LEIKLEIEADFEKLMNEYDQKHVG